MLLCPEECSIMLKPNSYYYATIMLIKKLQWVQSIAFKIDLMNQLLFMPQNTVRIIRRFSGPIYLLK